MLQGQSLPSEPGDGLLAMDGQTGAKVMKSSRVMKSLIGREILQGASAFGGINKLSCSAHPSLPACPPELGNCSDKR